MSEKTLLHVKCMVILRRTVKKNLRKWVRCEQMAGNILCVIIQDPKSVQEGLVFYVFFQYKTTITSAFPSLGPFIPTSTLQQLWYEIVNMFSLKTIVSFQIGVVSHYQVTPLFSMKTVSLASSQR